MAFATATSLSLAYPKWYVIVPSFAYAGTVAYSRMHLGVHYPSDVAAGAVIGAGCAYLTFLIGKALQKSN
jgi:membrane-associated phospholipid phosphatase